MQKCKAVDCENEAERIYCSESCRTSTTNRLYKDYNKEAEAGVRARKDKFAKLNKRCRYCLASLSYEKRHGEFCGHSCAASNTNRGRVGEKRVFSEQGKENIRKAIEVRLGR